MTLTHGHPQSREGQHVRVILPVTDRHHPLARNLQAPRHLRERPPLAALFGQHLQVVGLRLDEPHARNAVLLQLHAEAGQTPGSVLNQDLDRRFGPRDNLIRAPHPCGHVIALHVTPHAGILPAGPDFEAHVYLHQVVLIDQMPHQHARRLVGQRIPKPEMHIRQVRHRRTVVANGRTVTESEVLTVERRRLHHAARGQHDSHALILHGLDGGPDWVRYHIPGLHGGAIQINGHELHRLYFTNQPTTPDTRPRIIAPQSAGMKPFT